MPKALNIGRRHFTPEECRMLDVEEQARDESFFRLWARKEAVIKAVGTGLTMPLNRFDVSSSALTDDGWRTVSVGGERPSQWAVSDLPVPAGYRAALAVERRPANLCLWQV
jgi:4'-phosphopantetheinyl transferase